MNDSDISLVQGSCANVAPIKETAADIFYTDLFETAPHVNAHFGDADIKEQGAKLMLTLGVVLNGLRDLDMIVPVAQKLAERHVGYGVQPDDYDAVGASLIRKLENGLGDDFTAEVKDAWLNA